MTETITNTATDDSADAPSAETVAQGQRGRDVRGRFTTANREARTDGRWQFLDRGELPPELQPALDRFIAQVTTDQGGANELTAIQAAYIRRLAELEGCLLLLAADLQTRGLLTARGRVRNSYQLFLSTLTTWDRLAQRLGMNRVAKNVETWRELLDAPMPSETDENERVVTTDGTEEGVTA